MLIKFYLHKQAVVWLWLVEHKVPTPGLKGTWSEWALTFTANIKVPLLINHWSRDCGPLTAGETQAASSSAPFEELDFPPFPQPARVLRAHTALALLLPRHQVFSGSALIPAPFLARACVGKDRNSTLG